MSKVKLEPGPFVVPMPVALVGAEVNGKADFMTAAFIANVNMKPPVVACGLNPAHYTCDGISANGVFSINLPGTELVEVTDWCGLKSGKEHDTSKVFETFTGELEKAPMIKNCRLTAECRLLTTVPFAVNTTYFGEVITVYVDGEALSNGIPDWRKIDPLLFTFPDKGYWRLGEYLAEAWHVGKTYTP